MRTVLFSTIIIIIIIIIIIANDMSKDECTFSRLEIGELNVKAKISFYLNFQAVPFHHDRSVNRLR